MVVLFSKNVVINFTLLRHSWQRFPRRSEKATGKLANTMETNFLLHFSHSLGSSGSCGVWINFARHDSRNRLAWPPGCEEALLKLSSCLWYRCKSVNCTWKLFVFTVFVECLTNYSTFSKKLYSILWIRECTVVVENGIHFEVWELCSK